MKGQKIGLETRTDQEKNKEVEDMKEALQSRDKNPNTEIEISQDPNLMTSTNTEESTKVPAEALINIRRGDINQRQAKAISIKASTEEAEETVLHQVPDLDLDHQVEV